MLDPTMPPPMMTMSARMAPAPRRRGAGASVGVADASRLPRRRRRLGAPRQPAGGADRTGAASEPPDVLGVALAESAEGRGMSRNAWERSSSGGHARACGIAGRWGFAAPGESPHPLPRKQNFM